MKKALTTGTALIAAMTILAGAVQAETFSADVWADNWFEMRIDGTAVTDWVAI